MYNNNDQTEVFSKKDIINHETRKANKYSKRSNDYLEQYYNEIEINDYYDELDNEQY